MATTTNAAFKASFAELVKRTQANTDLLVRRVVGDFQRSLVLRSPVDTGRFRGNWQCGLGKVNLDTDSPPDKAGPGPVSRADAVMRQWKAGQTIYLTNSLPYARRLEYGWSRQQPQGMVRITVQEYSQKLAAQVARLPQRVK